MKITSWRVMQINSDSKQESVELLAAVAETTWA